MAIVTAYACHLRAGIAQLFYSFPACLLRPPAAVLQQTGSLEPKLLHPDMRRGAARDHPPVHCTARPTRRLNRRYPPPANSLGAALVLDALTMKWMEPLALLGGLAE